MVIIERIGAKNGDFFSFMKNKIELSCPAGGGITVTSFSAEVSAMITK